MPRQKSQASNRPAQHATLAKQKAKKREPQLESRRDDENKRRFIDQSGMTAQDLPDAAHGQNAVPDAMEMKRNLPQQHGGEVGNDPHAEGGLRGDRQMSDGDKHGGRRRN